MEIEVGSYWVEKWDQRKVVAVDTISECEGTPNRIVFFSPTGTVHRIGANYSISSFLACYRPLNRLEKLVILGKATSGN